jgi:hypothetical protein
MALSEPEGRRFARAMGDALPNDAAFDGRLKRHLPLLALRWVLILFNPFRSDRAAELPREPSMRRALLADRMGKAEKLLRWTDPDVVEHSIR